jgi:broad specificity phosphatase PhoE
MSDNKIVFIRHGESMGNVWVDAYKNEAANFLTIRGVKQVELAALDLIRLGITFDHVITSGLTRARQTATTLMQTMDDWQRHYVVEPRLNEWAKAGHIHDPGIEVVSRDEFRNRVVNAYRETVLPLINTGNVLVVSHFYVMEVIFELIGFGNYGDEITNSLSDDWIPNAVPYIYQPGNAWRVDRLTMQHVYVPHAQS